MHDSAWSKGLTVEVGGHGVGSHAGSAVLRLLADRTGLTEALSRAVRRRGFAPVHDRGRVLVDAAVCIADGGRVLSDLAALRDQAELFGSVASDATLWRALEEIGDAQRARVGRPLPGVSSCGSYPLASNLRPTTPGLAPSSPSPATVHPWYLHAI